MKIRFYQCLDPFDVEEDEAEGSVETQEKTIALVAFLDEQMREFFESNYPTAEVILLIESCAFTNRVTISVEADTVESEDMIEQEIDDFHYTLRDKFEEDWDRGNH